MTLLREYVTAVQALRARVQLYMKDYAGALVSAAAVPLALTLRSVKASKGAEAAHHQDALAGVGGLDGVGQAVDAAQDRVARFFAVGNLF